MARKKVRRRRGPKQFNLYSAFVGYGNLAILTQGIAGTSPVGMLSGSFDTYSPTGALVSGGPAVTLGDILQNPQMAFSTMQSNARANATSMAIQAITFNAGAKIFRKVMRMPFREANKVIRPLGLGVRL